MALKEHPFVVTTSFVGDGTTITYDKDADNRSTAVGKAFNLNSDGKAQLAGDGEAILGKVLAVDDDLVMTAAVLSGGLTFPLGDGATVARGDKIVGAVDSDSNKGFVKASEDAPDALADISAAPTQAQHNAVRDAVNDLSDSSKGRRMVVDFDTTHALVALI